MEIKFYTAGDDLTTLRNLLDSIDIFAVLTSLGDDRFVAQRDLSNLDEGYHQLWITATESLFIKQFDGAFVEVDPFVPWIGTSLFGDTSQPMSAVSGRIVQLNIRHNNSDSFDSENCSSFDWIGSRYRMIGSPAPATAQEAWQKLRKAMQKSAVKLSVEIELNVPVETTGKFVKMPAFFFPCAAAQFHAHRAAIGKPEKA